MQSNPSLLGPSHLPFPISIPAHSPRVSRMSPFLSCVLSLFSSPRLASQCLPVFSSLLSFTMKTENLSQHHSFPSQTSKVMMLAASFLTSASWARPRPFPQVSSSLFASSHWTGFRSPGVCPVCSVWDGFPPPLPADTPLFPQQQRYWFPSYFMSLPSGLILWLPFCHLLLKWRSPQARPRAASLSSLSSGDRWSLLSSRLPRAGPQPSYVCSRRS